MGSMSKGMEARSAELLGPLLGGLLKAGHRSPKVAIFDAGHQIMAVEDGRLIGRWTWEYSTTDPIPETS